MVATTEAQITCLSLDVGCGNNKVPGSVGIDYSHHTEADVIWDLDCYPYPFSSDQFERIYCNHIIEHISDVTQFLAELHRISKPEAIVEGITPHFSNPCSYADPTHRHHLSLRFLDFYISSEEPELRGLMRRLNDHLWFNVFGNISIHPLFQFTLLQRELSFPPLMKKIGIAAFANRYPDLYEFYFSGILKARDIHFILKVIKQRPLGT